MSHYGKQEIYALLDARGIACTALEHEAVYTMEDMHRAGILAHGDVPKNLFLRNAKGDKHYLVTVPEEQQVDMKVLRALIGSTRLSFGSAARLSAHLGVTQGCVSPLGVFNDESRSVTVIFDSVLRRRGKIGVHPNDNTATVWMDFDDLYRLIEEHGNPVRLIDFN